MGISGHFLVVFGIRSAPSQGFSRIRRGIRRHPRVRGRYVDQNGWFSKAGFPDLALQRCCLG